MLAPLVRDWYATGTRLVRDWYATGTRLVRDWDATEQFAPKTSRPGPPMPS
jgi:hypothetical protein